jgi:hypothetical protein
VSYFALVLFYTSAVLFSANHAVTKQHDSSFNAPPTEGNRFLLFLFQITFAIKMAVNFVHLNGQLGHQVKRFRTNGEEFDQSFEVFLKHITLNRTVVDATFDASFVPVTELTVVIRSTKRRNQAWIVLFVGSPNTVSTICDR